MVTGYGITDIRCTLKIIPYRFSAPDVVPYPVIFVAESGARTGCGMYYPVRCTRCRAYYPVHGTGCRDVLSGALHLSGGCYPVPGERKPTSRELELAWSGRVAPLQRRLAWYRVALLHETAVQVVARHG